MKNKQCCVRLPEELHWKVKMAAAYSGLTLQEWMIVVLENELSTLEEINLKNKYNKRNLNGQ